MEGYRTIAEAFRLLASLSLPLDLSGMELACVNAHARQERNRRAAERLAKIGYRAAAEAEGCCVATVYNRTHRNSKKTANA
jgi:hypothetical protein